MKAWIAYTMVGSTIKYYSGEGCFTTDLRWAIKSGAPLWNTREEALECSKWIFGLRSIEGIDFTEVEVPQ